MYFVNFLNLDQNKSLLEGSFKMVHPRIQLGINQRFEMKEEMSDSIVKLF